MSGGPNHSRASHWSRAVLTDIHFWIPVAVLLAGLGVLHWIH